MRSEHVSFANGRGQQLAGRLDLPVTGEPIAYALYAHCFTCTKGLRAIGHISRTLALHGIATLRFDFTGLGDSEGDFAETNFSSSVEDLVAAGRYLETNFGAPEVLVGHSLGGSAAIAAAPALPSVTALATIAAPASPNHIKRHIGRDLDLIEQEGQAEVLLAGRPFVIREQLIADVDSVVLPIGALRRALLILHSPVDNVVGVEDAAEIFTTARHPKSFISLDGADHLISRESDARYAAEMIATWASNYIEADLASHSQPDFLVDAPESVTVVRTEGGFRTEVISNGFPLVADEPASVGGTNTGPTPYDYLLTALGACTSMTLRMYADRKGWPLDAVQVELKHRKLHARDCEACETSDGFIDHIEKRIVVEGDLDPEKRSRLLEIADRCPVHKTLHGEVVIESALAPQS